MSYTISLTTDFKRNPYKGRFIVIEGIDGSGKSTQVVKVKKELEKQGRKVSVRNPFEGEIGKFVRSILAGKIKVPPIAIQYLISANRAVQQDEIIKDLKAGKDVIMDRYFWSAVAYAILDHPKIEKEEMKQWMMVGHSILSHFHQFLAPDFTFFLDISSSTAVERIDDMKKEKEIYENKKKIQSIEQIYHWLIKEYPNEFTVINGEQSIGEVTKEMVHIISSRK